MDNVYDSKRGLMKASTAENVLKKDPKSWSNKDIYRLHRAGISVDNAEELKISSELIKENLLIQSKRVSENKESLASSIQEYKEKMKLIANKPELYKNIGYDSDVSSNYTDDSTEYMKAGFGSPRAPFAIPSKTADELFKGAEAKLSKAAEAESSKTALGDSVLAESSKRSRTAEYEISDSNKKRKS